MQNRAYVFFASDCHIPYCGLAGCVQGVGYWLMLVSGDQCAAVLLQGSSFDVDSDFAILDDEIDDVSRLVSLCV